MQIEMSFIVITLGVITAMASLAFLAWRISKNNPGLSFGEIVMRKIFAEKVSVFLIIPILINIGQAGLAASIHPEGQADFPSVVRFLIHGSVSAVGIICALYTVGVHMLYKAERKAWEKKNSQKNWKDEGDTRIKGMLTLSRALLLGAIIAPLLNLLIIAGGMNQLTQLAYLFMPWKAYGGLSAIAYMDYIFQAELGATIMHYFLMGIDSLWIVVTPNSALTEALAKSLTQAAEDSSKKGGANKTVNRNASNKETEDLDSAEEGIKFLLSRYGYRQKHLNKMLNRCTTKLDAMDDTAAAKLAGEISKLKSDIQSADVRKKNMTQDEISDENFKIKEKIYSLFEKSSAQGKGFGIQLRKGTQFKNKGNS